MESDKPGRALRSLLLGYYDRGKLIFAGKAGTGFDLRGTSSAAVSRYGKSEDSTSMPSRGRAAGRSGVLASLSHRAGSDGPLHLYCIPLAATWRGDSLLVESLGDTSCGGNTLLAQSLDGCHGGILDHHNGRKPRPSLRANGRSRCTSACLVVLHVSTFCL